MARQGESDADTQAASDDETKKVQEAEFAILSDEDFIASLPEKELCWYEANRIPGGELEKSKIVCTACFKQINHKKEDVTARHPLLGVVMCKACISFYFDGSWTKDDDGAYEFCGWCANGGELYCCSDDSCPYSFCSACIKRNLGRAILSEIEDADDWLCFHCRPKQIRELRATYFSIYKYWKNEARKAATKPTKAIAQKKPSNPDDSVIVIDSSSQEEMKSESFNRAGEEGSLEAVGSTVSDLNEVLDIFSAHMEVFNRKWAKVKRGSDRETSWKLVRRMAKIVRITKYNLSTVASDLVKNVGAEIPDRDVAEIEDILGSSAGFNGCLPEEESQGVTRRKDEDGRKNEGISTLQEDAPEEAPDNVTTGSVGPANDSESAKSPLVEEKVEAGPSNDCEAASSQNGEEEANVDSLNDVETSSVQTDEGDGVRDDPKVTSTQKEEEVPPAAVSSQLVVRTSSTSNKTSPPTPQFDVSSPIKGLSSLNVPKSDDEGDGDAIEKFPLKLTNGDPSSPELFDDSRENLAPENSGIKVLKGLSVVDEEVKEEMEREKDKYSVLMSGSEQSSSQSESEKDDDKDWESGSKPPVKARMVKPRDGAGFGCKPSPASKKKVVKTSAKVNGGASKHSPESKELLEAKKEVLESSSGDESSDERPLRPSKLSKEERLRLRFDLLISKVDVKNDKKLLAGLDVVVDKMCRDVMIALQQNGAVALQDFPEFQKAITRRERNAAGSIMLDGEVEQLCNLGALNKKYIARCGARAGEKAKKKKKMKKEDPATDDVDDDDDANDVEDSESVTVNGDANGSAGGSMDLAQSVKRAVLESSASEKSDDDDSDDARAKKQLELKVENGTKAKPAPKGEGKKWSDPKFMRQKLQISDSDESENEKRALKRKNKLEWEREAKIKRQVLSSDEENSEEELPLRRRKESTDVKKASRNKDSDSDWSDEDTEVNKNAEVDSDSDVKPAAVRRKRKRARSSSPSSDEDSDEKDKKEKHKRRRRRIKKNSSSECEEDDDVGESPTKGRKNIKKIISDKKVSSSSKEAAIEERERRKRMEERQKHYNEIYDVEEGKKITELPLDIDTETKEPLVSVHPYLCKKLKPHQARGIKFMWDAVFESKEDVESDKAPGGAVLAHCMGLGKTLQTIGLLHTVMTAFPEKFHRALILSPVNTVKNWEDEFEKWLRGPTADDIEVYQMSNEKDSWGRADRLKMWKREGGVMIIGYDMFRNLCADNSKKFKKKQRDIFYSCLLDPGPQIVVCDEGHVLKNTKSALNAAVNRISTKRRLILTGTPLQNNLTEYFAMVNFVKPKLFGTYAEFKNRFVNPIQNGQHSDSTDRDVRIMKKRSFILSDLLKGCMQRLDYNVLMPYLQPKHEYVLCICLTDFQKNLYKFYLENYARAGQIGSDGKLEGGKKGGLFYDVQNLSRIWNHPFILSMAKDRADMRKLMEDDDDADEVGSLADFIDDGEDESEAKSTSSGDSSDDEDSRKLVTRSTRTTAPKEDIIAGGLEEARASALADKKGWWSQFLERKEGEEDVTDDDLLNRVELGSKIILLLDILKESEMIGDKVLVFSQSLLSLDIIEKFLSKLDRLAAKGKAVEGMEKSYLGSWVHGQDYFRMDGSTSADTRKSWCKYFNNVSNHRIRLFLISTKAGGLGINLVAANRVIIFDASWNPAHDVQSIFRVYRFGQFKPVYIYRFLAKGTMEEKIYDRQVTKQSLSARVVDEQQIERHFSMNDLAELYEFNDEPKELRPMPKVPKDLLLAELIKKHDNLIWKFHDHDSLLENQVDENLTEEERKAAWEEFENEKKGIRNLANTNMLNQNLLISEINPQAIQEQYRRQYPHLTEEQVIHATRAYIMQVQSGLTKRPAYDKAHYKQEMARAKQQQQAMYPGMYSRDYGSAASGSASNLGNMRQKLNDDYAEAQMIQHNYMRSLQQQQAAQLQYTQRLANIQKIQQANASAGESQQVITIDDGEHTDNEEIVLDGTPQTQVFAEASTGARRGRPRLDPETDTV